MANLSKFIVLAKTCPVIDWNRVRQAAIAIDPKGNWQARADGKMGGRLSGRGTVIHVLTIANPLPRPAVNNAIAKSFWMTPLDVAHAHKHDAHMEIWCELDTVIAPFTTIRRVAKVLSALLFVLCADKVTHALMNWDVERIFNSGQSLSQLGIVAHDEIPIQLWIGSEFPSATEDAVCIVTTGLKAFLNYEVEVWNAPGTLAQVGERFNHVLRYLLIDGPVVCHGDTIGVDSSDRKTRCFFALSGKTDRPHDSALHLEFDIIALG